jgi:hypothetical protein
MLEFHQVAISKSIGSKKRKKRKERGTEKKNSNKFTVHVYEEKIKKITVEVQMSKMNVKI